MGIISAIRKILIFVIIISFLIAFIPGIPPHVNFSIINTEPALKLEGTLKENNALDFVEKLYEGHISSPESIVSKNANEIFTGTRDGSIIRIWGNNWENSEVITRIGPGCNNYWDEHNCGRNLGLRFDKDGTLLVANSYLGIFSVDVKTGKKNRLFDPLTPIDGHKPLIIDDIDIDDVGNIYWSDASYLSNLADAELALFADASGRLIKYDPKTKRNTVLVSNILFANGVQLSSDGSFVLVAETGKYRVLRHWLKGPKSGKTEVFVSGLPGCPDNIRFRKNGGYYISLTSVKIPGRFYALEFLSQYPVLRRFIIRINFGIKVLADIVNEWMPNSYCAILSHHMLNLEFPATLDKQEGFVVEVDESGTIIGSLQGSGICHVSQTDQIGDDLFFGSPYNNYIGRLSLSRLKSSTLTEKVSTVNKDEL